MQLSMLNRDSFTVEDDKQNARCFYSSLSPVALLRGAVRPGATILG